METFFMSLRLFSATSSYFCDLKSEWPQIFRKRCSSTDSNRHQKFSLALRRPLPQISDIFTWQPQSNFSKKYLSVIWLKLERPRHQRHLLLQRRTNKNDDVEFGSVLIRLWKFRAKTSFFQLPNFNFNFFFWKIYFSRPIVVQMSEFVRQEWLKKDLNHD